MPSSTKLLYVALALLMVDSIIELAFITSMVSWLHVRAGKSFEVQNPAGGQFSLHGKPANFLLDQGHASNGASGTAFIPIGLGGILTLWLRHRQLKRDGGLHGFVRGLYNTWVVATAVSAIFSLACFIYVMAVTFTHTGQHIDVAVASRLNNHPYPNYVAYPLLTWTPQGWFSAVLQLQLVSSSDRSDIQTHLNVMRGWEWNVLIMTLLGFAVAILAFMDRLTHKQRASRAGHHEHTRLSKDDAPWTP